ncbi:MAG: OprO/OprP family phosphate-selective porin [bacterium]
MITKKSMTGLMAALLLAWFMNASVSASNNQSPRIDTIESKTPSRRRLVYEDTDLKKRKKQKATVDYEGVLMWDHDHYTGAHIDHTHKHYLLGNETELRRASLTFKSEIDNDWAAELEICLSDDDEGPEADDAFITFTGWDTAALIIGQTKEPFGLEELTSSKYTTTIERSMATAAFAPGAHPGIGVSAERQQFTWAIGIYEVADRKEKRDTYAVTGRLTFAPWVKKQRVMHLGVSGSLRNLDGEKHKIKENAEVHTAEEIVISPEIPADRLILSAFEACWIWGPFSFQTEYMRASVKAPDDLVAFYGGYYAQGSYFVTGEIRPYKKGGFKEIEPQSSLGALEMVCRYSALDVRDRGRGDAAINVTLGMNYYSNKHVRIMINYIHTTLKGDIPENEKKAKAISYRLQYSF